MRPSRAVLAMAAVTASLASPAIASAAPSISVAPTGQLGPEGATAVVSVTVTCDPGTSPSVNVTLAQSQANRLAQGSGFPAFDAIVCDGAPHVVPVTVSNSPGVFPYRQGKATATATMFVFSPTGSSMVSTGPQPIRLRK